MNKESLNMKFIYAFFILFSSLSLYSASSEGLGIDTAHESESEQSTEESGSSKKKCARFIGRLKKMVDDESRKLNPTISWSNDYPNAFTIPDTNNEDFQKLLRDQSSVRDPRSALKSFLRQLNYYDFKKVSGKATKNCVHQHEYFTKDGSSLHLFERTGTLSEKFKAKKKEFQELLNLYDIQSGNVLELEEKYNSQKEEICKLKAKCDLQDQYLLLLKKNEWDLLVERDEILRRAVSSVSRKKRRSSVLTFGPTADDKTSGATVDNVDPHDLFSFVPHTLNQPVKKKKRRQKKAVPSQRKPALLDYSQLSEFSFPEVSPRTDSNPNSPEKGASDEDSEHGDEHGDRHFCQYI